MPNWDFRVDPVPTAFDSIEQPLFLNIAEVCGCCILIIVLYSMFYIVRCHWLMLNVGIGCRSLTLGPPSMDC
jgi:hypothetical protein